MMKEEAGNVVTLAREGRGFTHPSSRNALHSHARAGTDVSFAATPPTHGQTHDGTMKLQITFSFNYKHLDILWGWGLSVTQASHEFLDSSNPPVYFLAGWATHTFHSTASYFWELKAILHQSKNLHNQKENEATTNIHFIQFCSLNSEGNK